MYKLTTFLNNNGKYVGNTIIIRQATLSDAFGISKVH